MPRRPPARLRSIRIHDADWDAAMRRADADGEILSEQIREFVRRYGRAYRRPPKT